MKISNIRIEQKDGQSFLKVDISVKYTETKELWFSVPSEYESWLTYDVYDAFLVAAIYPAMYYNEPIEIDGCVSHRLYYNVVNYVESIVDAFRDGMHTVPITVKGFANAEQRYHYVGTGFSAGVDSFATFYDHFEKETDPDYKISALFFFNVGSHGGGGEIARRTYMERYKMLKAFPEEVGLPYIPMDSNLFDFYLKHWEFDAGQFCRSCAVLVFEAALDKYYISSDYSYKETMFYHFNRKTTSFSELAETFANPLMSTETTEVITDGCQRIRTEKTQILADYKPAQKYLNVCITLFDDQHSVRNCSRCHKCIRTLVALDALGVLDNFSEVFDLEEYYKHRFRNKCYMRLWYNTSAYIKDDVDLAERVGKPFPSYPVALLYISAIRLTHIPYKLINWIKSL